MSRYAKLLAAIAGAIAVVLASALTDNHLSLVESVQVAVAVVTCIGVWLAANVPSAPYAKTVIAGTLAALDLVIVYLSDSKGISLTGAEWANVAIAALTAGGVLLFRNGSRTAADDPQGIMRP